MTGEHDSAVVSIEREIIAWIRSDRASEGLDEIEVDPETALLDEQILDSMKVLEFVAWLEACYAISVGVKHMTRAFFASPRAVAANVVALRQNARGQVS